MNFRQYKTSSGKRVLLGKSAETNEELLAQAGKSELILHTSKPGSPFANIKSEGDLLQKEDIYEGAIMCAKHSQDWRDNKKDVKVHLFLGSDTFKEKSMSLGTFGVKKFKELLVRKEDILNFEKSKSL